MLPVASSVKGRKVRIRARVQLPNHYPAPRQVTMVQKQVTEPFRTRFFCIDIEQSAQVTGALNRVILPTVFKAYG